MGKQSPRGDKARCPNFRRQFSRELESLWKQSNHFHPCKSGCRSQKPFQTNSDVFGVRPFHYRMVQTSPPEHEQSLTRKYSRDPNERRAARHVHMDPRPNPCMCQRSYPSSACGRAPLQNTPALIAARRAMLKRGVYVTLVELSFRHLPQPARWGSNRS